MAGGIGRNETLAPALRDVRQVNRRMGIAWALWAAASALPWVLANHADPWPTFYGEAMMAAVMLSVAIWSLWTVRGAWRIDVLAGAFALASLVPLLQALGGMFSLPTEAPLVSQYLSAFTLTLLVARHAEDRAPLRIADGTFAGLTIAALASMAFALHQWLDLETLGVLLAPGSLGQRPLANLGQPNHLSTLLVWGLVGIWWAHARRSVGATGAVLAAAFLLMGVALTQSRTGVLAVGMLGIAALTCRHVLRTADHPALWWGLALWFIACLAALEPLNHHLLDAPTRSLADQAAPLERLNILRTALHAIVEQPWLGYGWNQIVTAHVALAEAFPLHGTVTYAHNLVLDLMLWNGVPLGALMVGGLLLWWRHMLRGRLTAEQVLLMLGLAVLTLHALLEFPHAFAYFLLPAAVMMGTLNAIRPLPTLISVPRGVIGVVVLCHAAMLVQMFNEYGRIEIDVRNARMRAARIANVVPTASPDVLLLHSLQEGLRHSRVEPRRGMTSGELEQFRRSVTRYPTPPGLYRYAQAAALNGQPDEAKRALAVLCSLHSLAVCRAATQDWMQMTLEGNPATESVEVPPVR